MRSLQTGKDARIGVIPQNTIIINLSNIQQFCKEPKNRGEIKSVSCCELGK